MSVPIAEKILSRVYSRLSLITTGNGYNQTVTVLRPLRLNEDLPGDYRLILGSTSHTPNSALSRPGNPPAMAYDLEVTIEAEIRPSDSDTTAMDNRRMTLLADCKKALTDATDWYRWQGYAMDTKWGATTLFVSGDGGSYGFAMKLLIEYRVSEDDPYEVRA
jgi:hypothetical protein